MTIVKLNSNSINHLANPTYSPKRPRADRTPDLWTDDGQLKMSLDDILEITRSPFISPLLYDRFDQLPGVPLYLITTEFCPFLDESISLAKLWKGACSLRFPIFPKLFLSGLLTHASGCHHPHHHHHRRQARWRSTCSRT